MTIQKNSLSAAAVTSTTNNAGSRGNWSTACFAIKSSDNSATSTIKNASYRELLANYMLKGQCSDSYATTTKDAGYRGCSPVTCPRGYFATSRTKN